jgi:hypothetical protein
MSANNKDTQLIWESYLVEQEATQEPTSLLDMGKDLLGRATDAVTNKAQEIGASAQEKAVKPIKVAAEEISADIIGQLTDFLVSAGINIGGGAAIGMGIQAFSAALLNNLSCRLTGNVEQTLDAKMAKPRLDHAARMKNLTDQQAQHEQEKEWIAAGNEPSVEDELTPAVLQSVVRAEIKKMQAMENKGRSTHLKIFTRAGAGILEVAAKVVGSKPATWISGIAGAVCGAKLMMNEEQQAWQDHMNLLEEQYINSL